ncbi:MAG TPA: Fur family transcriptional regulator [Chloroflexota bacterium]|nr:Fur family transcriptional regulator [Chloroflexota bacterium]
MLPLSDRADQLVGRLQASGHRLTPQRLALVDLLASDTSHPSAEQVYSRLKAQYPTISLATVYNTLEMLVTLGEALPLDLNDGCTRYDVLRPSAHPHVICRRCGMVADLDLDGVDTLLDRARAAIPFEDLQARVHFEGICPACARQTPEPEEASGA